jgi:inner membrane protein
MTGRTHDLAAFTGLVIAFCFLPSLPEMSLATAVTAFGANFIGGLFPDIDQPTSDFWDNFRLGPFVAKIFCPLIGGHRHVSHSLLGVGIIGAGSHWLFQAINHILLIDFQIVWWAFMIGIASHLATDLLTKDGLPLLWPLKWRLGFPPLKVMRMTSGSWMEKIVVFPGLILISGYLLFNHQSKVLDFIHRYIT